MAAFRSPAPFSHLTMSLSAGSRRSLYTLYLAGLLLRWPPCRAPAGCSRSLRPLGWAVVALAAVSGSFSFFLPGLGVGWPDPQAFSPPVPHLERTAWGVY